MPSYIPPPQAPPHIEYAEGFAGNDPHLDGDLAVYMPSSPVFGHNDDRVEDIDDAESIPDYEDKIFDPNKLKIAEWVLHEIQYNPQSWLQKQERAYRSTIEKYEQQPILSEIDKMFLDDDKQDLDKIRNKPDDWIREKWQEYQEIQAIQLRLKAIMLP